MARTILLAVLALFLIGWVLLIGRPSADRDEAARASAETPSARSLGEQALNTAPSPEPALELDVPDTTIARTPLATGPALEESGPDQPAPDSMGPDPAIAWFHGRIVLPENVPSDETIQLQLRGAYSKQRIKPDSEGRFRFWLDPKTRSARLHLEARYVYLERRADLRRDELGEPLELHPKLGGRIVGHASLSSDSTRPLGNRIRFRVALPSDLPCDSCRKLRGETNKHGSFEISQVPAGSVTLMCENEDLLLPELAGLDIRPGATRRLRLTARSGLELKIRVREALGAPSDRAHIELHHARGTEYATTNANGEALFRGLAPGLTGIEARKSGFQVERSSFELTPRSTDTVDVLLQPAGSVSGRVLWDDGTPAQAVVRAAYPLDPDSDTLTDDEGRFELLGLRSPAGPLLFSATREANGTSWYSEKQIEVAGTESNLEVELVEGAALTLLAQDDSGKAAALLSVRLLRCDRDGMTVPQKPRFFRAGGADRVCLEGLPHGYWSVAAFGEESVLSPEAVVLLPRREPLVLSLSSWGSVAGLVLSADGRPAALATVQLFSDSRPQPPGDEPTTMTAEDGSFTLRTPPGTFALVAEHPGAARSTARALSLQSGERRTGVILRLRPSSTLRGTCRFEGEARTMRVQLRRGDPRDPLNFRRTVITDEDGSFEFTGLEPGRYDVEALELGYDGQAQQTRRVALAEGETISVELRLR